MDIEGGGQDALKDLRNWESKPLLDPRYWHSCSMIWGLTEERSVDTLYIWWGELPYFRVAARNVNIRSRSSRD